MKPSRTLLCALIISALCSFTLIYELKTNTAEADQVNGIFIFYHCRPVKQYTYLGTVTLKLVWSDKPGAMTGTMIKRVKEKYPTANAIIFQSESFDKADAIYINQ